jgi:RHS repeat-associated protein
MTTPAASLFSEASGHRSISTGKERDTESGNDYFGARYYASSMGRFMSPDWSAKVEPVPYARMDNPQTLNLYTYLRNNPLAGVDADGHCSGDGCDKVTVTVTPPKQPVTVDTRTQTFKSANGTSQTVTTTGPSGNLNMVVKVGGTPTDGVKVSETNQNTVTTPVETNSGGPKVEGTSVTQDGGKYPDTVGTGYTPQQLAAANATTQDAKDAFNLVPTTLVNVNTVTLGIPAIGDRSAFTCQATSTRTITNTSDGKTISPGGYTLTTTQPVVRNP